MGHKFDMSNILKLDNPKRRSVLPPEVILDKIGIEQTHKVADIGCGIGYFTVPLSRRVKMVYGIDPSIEMLEELQLRMEKHQIQNITPVHSEYYDFHMKDQVDIGFVCTVTHEIDDLQRFIDEIRKMILPGGKIVVVDWAPTKRDIGPPASHCLSEETIVKVLEKSGFMNSQIEDSNQYYYIISGTN